MRKKVLIAEQSDAIRNIAESILHQNGFDVISCSAGDKAKALIISEQPNLVIIGADIRDNENNYLYDSLGDNKATSSIPLLLIEDPNGNQVPYPPEVVLSRPFDPNDFLDKVSTFVGAGDAQPVEKITESSPFGEGAVNDEILDAALGIDEIEVEDSEVMDQTWTSRSLTKAAKAAGKDAFDIVQHTNGDAEKVSKSGKVESLLIRDEQQEQAKTGSVAESTKIQIESDQYGMTAPNEEPGPVAEEPQNDDHDYDWFLNEMKNDGSENKTPAKKPVNDTDPNLKVTQPSDTMEPIKTGKPTKGRSESTPGGVDQFISDFKKEMQQITTDSDKQSARAAEGQIKKQFESELENISSEPVRATRAKEAGSASGDKTATAVADTNAAIDPEEIRRMSTYLVELLAERLAKNIVDKIDREEICQILREELPHILEAKK